MAKKLCAKLDRIRGDLEEFQIFVQEYEASKRGELEIRLEDILGLNSNYLEVYDELIGVDTHKDNLGVYKNQLKCFKDMYFAIVAQAKEFVRQINACSTPFSQVMNATVIEPKIKLPTLNVPTFYGKLEDFAEFRDTFTAIIHDNPALGNAEKFFFLRTSLKGDAAKVIQALGLSDLNYDVAWTLLKERYENLKLLVNGHIRAILDVPSLTKEDGGRLRIITDTLNRNIRCLRTLDVPVDTWDLMLIYVISNKLDYETKRAWESEKTVGKLPTMKEFLTFLQTRCNLLETIGMPRGDATNKRHTKMHFYVAVNDRRGCSMCSEGHELFRCNKFLALNIDQRRDKVKRERLCFNCLREAHAAKACKARKCYKCGRSHHTLLHEEEPSRAENRQVVSENMRDATGEAARNTTALTSTEGRSIDTRAWLATAIVEARSADKRYYPCRVLLDCGSQSNFISLPMCERLKLPKQELSMAVNGIGVNQTDIRFITTAQIRARFGSYEKTMEFLVLDKIANDVPSISCDINLFKIPNHVRLADEGFHQRGKVDMIIGVGAFWEIVGSRKIRLGDGLPMLCQSTLGWFVAGGMNTSAKEQRGTQSYCAVMEDLTKFWEMEEVPTTSHLSPEEELCKEYFKRTTRRNEEGRFIVSIPLREELTQLCKDSRQQAEKRLLSMERRLAKNSKMRDDYRKGMQDYISSGHMTERNEAEGQTNNVFYLPHHAVVKDSSLTTKLRIVFDGSARSGTGLSLNDAQMCGPTVQADLLSILLRFRTFKFVLSADIERMYRQILVEERQRDLQRVLWRKGPEESIKCYT